MALARTKPGRKPLAGARYDCGRRRPTGDPRGNRDWQYLRQHGQRLAADPKLNTEIGRLAFDGQLTDTQVEAAFVVGRIYAEFRQFKRKRSTAASPGYMRAFGDPDGQDPEEPDELDALERRIRRAVKRFEKLEACYAALPPGPAQRVRKAIETLCVEDGFVGAAEIEESAPMLDWIAAKFGLAAAPPPRSIAVMGRSARRRPRQQVLDRRVELDKVAWLACTGQMLAKKGVPATAEELEAEWRGLQERQRTERDRESFRVGKARAR